MVWISSPAGAGKTALVSSYVGARDIACLWYRVDATDDDPASFFHYFGLAAKTVTESRRPVQQYSSELRAMLPAFSRAYFRDVFGRFQSPGLLVFDNFQDASATGPLSVAMRAAFAELPPGLNALIITRNELPAVLSRLRTDQRLATLGWRDLRLTEAETRDVAKLKLGSISRQEADRLYRQTDGWAAALALMLEEQTPAGTAAQIDPEQSRHAVFGYLSGELLGGVDDATRARLAEIALLPRITLHAAETAAGDSRALQVLGAWARRGFLISARPGTPLTYQMHPMLRAFLLHEAAESLGAKGSGDVRRHGAEIETTLARQAFRRHEPRPPSVTSDPHVCPAPIHVFGFGPMRIQSNGSELRTGRKRSRRPLQLLGVLVALGGERISQETLGDLLWPDADGDRQAGSLRSTIHRLRSLLGDKQALVTEEQRLSLDSNRVCVDVFAFQRQLAEASKYPAESGRALALVARAVDLYRGPLLADEQEEWLVPARERLRRAYETAVGQLATARLAVGDTGAALELYRRALVTMERPAPFRSIVG